MSQIRTRPIEKPLILQSYIYNHRSQYNQSSPQASFLKLSEKNSTELQALQQSSLFADMQNRLNRLEEKSVGKICEIQREIKERERYKQASKPCKASLIRDKRQKEVMTYRKLQGCAYNLESFEQSNFQMDENLNYVRDAHNEMSSNLVRDMVEAKGINSEPFGKESFNLRQVRPCDRNNKSNVSRRSSFLNKNQESPCNQREHSQNSSKGKRKLSSNSCKDSKTGSYRIYEQILSNYSTAKLLAMQKKLP